MNRMLARLEDSRDRQQQFVADASHELRSPLASIRQTAEVARAHPGALPEGELAEAVLEESARMQRLVEQLLLLTRADEGAVRARARRTSTSTTWRWRRRGGCGGPGSRSTRRASDAGRVRGDADRAGQVVRNLADNAARHAARRGGGRRPRPTATASSSSSRTTGRGSPRSSGERVFERFVRLDEARARDAGGSGLGLAIVQEIVAAHGGTVEVSSSPLGGARFVVRLPARGLKGAPA